MEILYENIELLCEDFGGGEWEVEYSVSAFPIPHSEFTSPPCSANAEREYIEPIT